MTVKRALLYITIPLAVFLLAAFAYYLYYKQWSKSRYDLVSLVGTKFDLDNFVDPENKQAHIDFTKSKITIVDFWFKDCPPCLDDMAEFTKLIKGRENEVAVVSICINNYSYWQPLFKATDPKFAVLKTKLPNWQHLALKSRENKKLKNPIPPENIQLIQDKFISSSYPVYLVVNSKQEIIAVPGVASVYIKRYFSKQ